MLCGDMKVGFRGLLLGIQEVILSRSRRYGLMTSKTWVVLGKMRNNFGCSKESKYAASRPEVVGSKSKKRTTTEWISGGKRILREDLDSVKARW